MEFTKHNVKPLEIELQRLVADKYLFSPKILRVEDETVIMEKINGNTLFDLYEDDPKSVPQWIWDEIHRMLEILFEREGIEFIDISSFNIMVNLEDKKVYVIDYGHAKYTSVSKGERPSNWFLKDFLDGLNEYNPDFK
jgi:RIO-like serine/threonine protein kinase